MTSASPSKKSRSTMSSWVEVAADSDFPIQNLPWGVVSRAGSDPFCATIIGEFVINLNALASAGHLPSLGAANVGVFGESSLNTFMGLGKAIWVGVRGDLTSLLSVDGANAAALRDDAALRAAVLCPVEECANLMPATIGDYTDFYASREHATNVGTMFRGVENALQPNWTRLPVGYHGELCSPCEREREEEEDGKGRSAVGGVWCTHNAAHRTSGAVAARLRSYSCFSSRFCVAAAAQRDCAASNA